jgi:hypothetical protein
MSGALISTHAGFRVTLNQLRDGLPQVRRDRRCRRVLFTDVRVIQEVDEVLVRLVGGMDTS